MGPGLRQLRPRLPTRSPARTGASGGNRRTGAATARPWRQRRHLGRSCHSDWCDGSYLTESSFRATLGGSSSCHSDWCGKPYLTEGFFWATFGGSSNEDGSKRQWSADAENARASCRTNSRRRSAWHSSPLTSLSLHRGIRRTETRDCLVSS